MPYTLALMDLNPVHIIIVVGIILLLFGGARIPELMRGLGSGMKEFKKGIQEDEEEKKPAAPKP